MSSNKFREIYQTSLSLFRSGDFPSALKKINEALEIQPKNYQSLHLKGLILKRQNNKLGALECYRNALECCNDNQKKEKITTLYQNLKTEINNELLFKVEKESPEIIKSEIFQNSKKGEDDDNIKKIENLNSKIQEKLDEEKFTEAINYIDQVISLLSQYNESVCKNLELDQYFIAKAFSLFNLGNYNGAKLCLHRALQINPNNSDAQNLNQEIKEYLEKPEPSTTSLFNKKKNYEIAPTINLSSILGGIFGIILFIAIIFVILSLLSGSGSSSNPSPEIPVNPQLSKNSGSSSIVQQSNNKIETCMRIARQYANSHDYQRDTYDCDDMAMDVWNMLQKEGINAKIAIGNVEKNIQYPWESDHAWVLAEVNPDEWLALEATGGFIERENKLYYQGWFFRSPLEMKEYRELQNQYNSQIDKLNKAIDEYNSGVDQLNRIDDYDSGQYLQAGIDYSSASSVLQERYNDLAETQDRMLILLKGHSLSDSESNPVDTQQKNNPSPISTPVVQITEHSGDLLFASTLISAGQSLDSSRINIINRANAGDMIGVLSEINQLEATTEKYAKQINGLDLSSKYWNYRDYVVEGLDNYRRGCRDLKSAISRYNKKDYKTYQELLNQATGELQAGNADFIKSEVELKKIST